eukprot:Nk52_evm10s295 gene=Nk52_evmTU10s295
MKQFESLGKEIGEISAQLEAARKEIEIKDKENEELGCKLKLVTKTVESIEETSVQLQAENTRLLLELERQDKQWEKKRAEEEQEKAKESGESAERINRLENTIEQLRRQDSGSVERKKAVELIEEGYQRELRCLREQLNEQDKLIQDYEGQLVGEYLRGLEEGRAEIETQQTSLGSIKSCDAKKECMEETRPLEIEYRKSRETIVTLKREEEKLKETIVRLEGMFEIQNGKLMDCETAHHDAENQIVELKKQLEDAKSQLDEIKREEEGKNRKLNESLDECASFIQQLETENGEWEQKYEALQSECVAKSKSISSSIKELIAMANEQGLGPFSSDTDILDALKERTRLQNLNDKLTDSNDYLTEEVARLRLKHDQVEDVIEEEDFPENEESDGVKTKGDILRGAKKRTSFEKPKLEKRVSSIKLDSNLSGDVCAIIRELELARDQEKKEAHRLEREAAALRKETQKVQFEKKKSSVDLNSISLSLARTSQEKDELEDKLEEINKIVEEQAKHLVDWKALFDNLKPHQLEDKLNKLEEMLDESRKENSNIRKRLYEAEQLSCALSSGIGKAVRRSSNQSDIISLAEESEHLDDSFDSEIDDSEYQEQVRNINAAVANITSKRQRKERLANRQRIPVIELPLHQRYAIPSLALLVCYAESLLDINYGPIFLLLSALLSFDGSIFEIYLDSSLVAVKAIATSLVYSAGIFYVCSYWFGDMVMQTVGFLLVPALTFGLLVFYRRRAFPEDQLQKRMLTSHEFTFFISSFLFSWASVDALSSREDPTSLWTHACFNLVSASIVPALVSGAIRHPCAKDPILNKSAIAIEHIFNVLDVNLCSYLEGPVSSDEKMASHAEELENAASIAIADLEKLRLNLASFETGKFLPTKHDQQLENYKEMIHYMQRLFLNFSGLRFASLNSNNQLYSSRHIKAMLNVLAVFRASLMNLKDVFHAPASIKGADSPYPLPIFDDLDLLDNCLKITEQRHAQFQRVVHNNPHSSNSEYSNEEIETFTKYIKNLKASASELRLLATHIEKIHPDLIVTS